MIYECDYKIHKENARQIFLLISKMNMNISDAIFKEIFMIPAEQTAENASVEELKEYEKVIHQIAILDNFRPAYPWGKAVHNRLLDKLFQTPEEDPYYIVDFIRGELGKYHFENSMNNEYWNEFNLDEPLSKHPLCIGDTSFTYSIADTVMGAKILIKYEESVLYARKAKALLIERRKKI